MTSLRAAFCARWASLRLTLVAMTFAVVAQGTPQDARATTHTGGSRLDPAKSETINGTLSGVDPVKGILIVARRGPHEPSSVQLSWTETVSSETGGHAEKSPITVSQGPGETIYDFRVTPSTLIRVNGASASLENLAKYPNAKATVRFTPRRDGNFAFEITVRH